MFDGIVISNAFLSTQDLAPAPSSDIAETDGASRGGRSPQGHRRIGRSRIKVDRRG